MTRSNILQAALVAGFSLLAMAAAHAATPVASIAQLSGQVMVVRPDGRPRILSTASRVEVGDTLVSEQGSYVRLALDNGNQVVLGPLTSLRLADASPQQTALVLVGGQVQVTAGSQQAGHRLTLEAGASRVDAGAATFTAMYSAPRDAALARREAYLRSSLAAAAIGTMTDGVHDLPLRQVVAQVVPRSVNAVAPGLPPGLHVFVVAGALQLTNAGGSSQFSSGQFGYTGSTGQPPILLPANPGLVFTPPPVFLQSPAGPSGSGSAAKPGAIDCEVR